MQTDLADTDRIIAFIRAIGIPVGVAAVEDGFLPGVAIRAGGIVYDPGRLAWAGDLLHEAGHIAVTDAALRPTLDEVEADGGEEMATIAWTYAAALAIGIEPTIVFHAGGYGKGGEWIADVFAADGLLGQPLLHAWGMTHALGEPPEGATVYPRMERWLR